MYIFIKPETPDSGETLIVVQAVSADEAKAIAGVEPGFTRWAFVEDGLISGLAGEKRGYIEKMF